MWWMSNQRRLRMGVSDHYVDLCMIKWGGGIEWEEKIKEVGKIKSEKLCKQYYKKSYKESTNK